MQQETPHALMGRISSTVMSVVFFAQVLGLVLSGVLGQALGVRAVFFLCAALAATLAAAGHFFLSKARRPPPRLPDVDPNRAGHARAAETAVAVRVLGQVLLVVVLGVVELGRRDDLRRDRAVAGLRQLRLERVARRSAARRCASS